MSSSKGSFAGFFPSAPSVQQQKRKRAALDRERTEAASSGLVNGDTSPNDQAEQSSSHDVRQKRQRLSTSDQETALYESYSKEQPLNGDAGDSSNGVGSASSLNSAVSSVFSAASQTVMLGQHNGNGAGPHSLTPLTNIGSSPPERHRSPGSGKAILNSQHMGTAAFPHDGDDHRIARSSSVAITPEATPPQIRIEPRPPTGETKGIKAIYDPELDTRLSAKDKRKLKIRYRKFGEDVSVKL